MPGIVVPGTDRHPSAGQKTATASSSIPETSGSDGRHISMKKPYRPDSDSYQVQTSSKLKLAMPLAKKERRAIKKETKKLIKARNILDEEVLRLAKKTNLDDGDDWLPQDELLRDLKHLERQEIGHLRERTKKLAELERLCQWDPSSDRAYDHDLVRRLLWRFKRNLGPLLNQYTNHLDDEKDDNDDDDESSSSGSNLDSDPEPEESDIFDNEDEELRHRAIAAKPYSHRKLEYLKQVDLHSQNSNSTDGSATGTPLSAKEDGVKRKREDELTEGTPSNEIGFTPDGDVRKLTSRQKNKDKKRKRAKQLKKEQRGPSQEKSQTNDT